VFEVTVLGSSGSHAGPGRVCSGYLVQAGDTRLLVDCGNGASANLARLTAFEALDAILITHRHVDHCVDLIGMFYALKFHRDGMQSVPLYAAPLVVEALTGLLSGDSAMEFREVFACQEVRGGDRLSIGPIDITLADSIHPVPTVSVRLQAFGKTIVYSSDSAGGPALVDLARGADLFLCEATWQGDIADYPEGIHLTALQAGEVGQKAGVRRLALTHILGSLDPKVSVREARETFDGDLDFAQDLRTWVLD
jgi:ribonuclease BN (tRNA processing enzyme)